MSDISLRPIDEHNYRPIAELSNALPADQQRYVAHNAISMLDVYNDSEHLSQLAAYADDMPVGYVMYGFDPDTRDWWIVRLMVAHDQQGKGYGRAIMQAVIAQLSAQPGCDAIHISFVPENAAARALYSSLGFVDTGRIEDGEVVYRLALMGNAQP